MIKKVTLRNFKCFREEVFEMNGDIILAGPNNSGKTTLIQSIAVWHFALSKWLEKKGNSGAKKRAGIPITRRELLTLPMRELNLLWHNTSTALKKEEGNAGAPRVMSITLEGESRGKTPWDLTMEFRYHNSELVYVKPAKEPDKKALSELVVYIPPFSGISAEEPIYTSELQEWIIGQGKPGDIIRNLLVKIYEKSETEWENLNKEIEGIFGYSLLPPKYIGHPFILCSYLPGIPPAKGHGGLPVLDIANSGSGFLQTVMLLAFFYARPATILLIDEPDAHLHIILQGQMHNRLQTLAQRNHAQLIIATHSEVLINNTPAEEIISFYGKPHTLLGKSQRDAVREALKQLSATDIILAEGKKILYVESESDIKMLRIWAKILDHPVYHWLSSKEIYCHPIRSCDYRVADNHFFALRAIHKDMKGMILLDSDGKGEIARKGKSGQAAMYVWKRYEIENYLLHPESIRRFVNEEHGGIYINPVIEKMRKELPLSVIDHPLNDHDYLEKTPASKKILPKILECLRVPKTDYHLIAKFSRPDEIHQDIKAFFDLLAKKVVNGDEKI